MEWLPVTEGDVPDSAGNVTRPSTIPGGSYEVAADSQAGEVFSQSQCNTLRAACGKCWNKEAQQQALATNVRARSAGGIRQNACGLRKQGWFPG